MRKIKAFLLSFCLLIPYSQNVLAGDIEQGTISAGASSNLFFQQYESEYSSKDRETFFSAEMGYFVAKNFEIGAGLSFRYGDSSGGGSSHSYILTPYLGYHWNLNEKSNIYTRVGVGFGMGKSSGDGWESDGKISTVFGEVGYEFFLLENIALDFSCMAERYWSESSYEDDEWYWEDEEDTNTANIVTTQLKFKLYF